MIHSDSNVHFFYLFAFFFLVEIVLIVLKMQL